MKAISLKQPWANMIADGEKTIETRTWSTKYRGPLLIVSSKKPNIEPAGCIVAIVNLVDVRPMTQEDVESACCELYPKAQAWILRDVEKINPIPVKGRLRIFNAQFTPDRFVFADEGTAKNMGDCLTEFIRREISFSLFR